MGTLKSRSARFAANAAGLVLAICSTARYADADPPNLSGVWSGPTQMLDDESWGFEDFACFLGCPSATFDYARALFADPQSFDRSYPELQAAVLRRRTEDIVSALTPAALDLRQRFDPADDPAIQCQAYGLVRQALSPLPLEIVQASQAVTIRYELWEARRTISLVAGTRSREGRSRLGRSIGRYEGETLVVETTGITRDVVAADARVQHSDSLRTIERYWLTDDGNRLNLELTLIDPRTFSEPLALRTAWRRTPAMGLLPYACRLIGTVR
jgi:hypothetical protein